jgi:quinol monooxygenase YgiN
MYVAEFSLHAKPGHYDDVAGAYSAFAAEYLSTHEALVSVLVTGDEASGVVRGVGVWADRDSADSVNSDPEFAAFNEIIEPWISAPAERVELALLHLFSRD